MVILVLLADDNLNVREVLKALLDLDGDPTVVGPVADYDGLDLGVEDAYPQVIVTDVPCRATSRARASKLLNRFVSLEHA
jgi:DNA-binding NarL/FixJ family response regulator